MYAVHRTKIESHETDFTTKLIPMQPSSQRSSALSGGQANTPLSHKPLDFTCTELDLSDSNGAFLFGNHPHATNTRLIFAPRHARCDGSNFGGRQMD